jgi:hypothetical protein
MSPEDLRCYPLVYLATNYSRYGDGHEAAFRVACEIAAKLLREGVRVFSPIAHGHPISYFGDIDPIDDALWSWFDEVMVERCDTVLVAEMGGWQRSRGIAREIEAFEDAGKPVYYLDLESFEVGTSAFT